jgi:2-phosphosulfolactate phosphatase
VLGSFINRKILSRWIVKQKKPVIILCAGWKNQFNLEDALFCGALIESLLDTGKYAIDCDSAHASLDLWSLAKADIIRYIDKASHLKRLRALGVDDVVQYTFTPDTSQIVPVMKGDRIVSA